jgi:hypothetical protein
MAASWWRGVIALILLTTGCAAPTPSLKRIVLLAPFESTYREVGYDALYPIKLALADVGYPDVQLISVDDGGSIENAVLRAHALEADPTIYLALVTGPIATDQRVLDVLGNVPTVVIGEWSARPGESVFVLASDQIEAQRTAWPSNLYDAALAGEATGGELFGLKALAAVSQDTSGITVLTSALPPTTEFRERLLDSGLFVPEPGLLATLAYDAGTAAARAVAQSFSRTDVLASLRSLTVNGINGEIRFNEEGYWSNAPVYAYRYTGGILTPINP